jgi:hypothetical protein
MKTQVLLDLFNGSLHQIQGVTADIPDDRCCEMPGGVRNHVLWTLAHMCVANDFALQLLGKKPVAPADWKGAAGNSSMPLTDPSRYPSKAESLAMLEKQTKLITDAVTVAAESAWDEPMPEAYRAFFPTIGHGMVYFLTSHPQNHLGQLLAWKRAAGLGK